MFLASVTFIAALAIGAVMFSDSRKFSRGYVIRSSLLDETVVKLHACARCARQPMWRPGQRRAWARRRLAVPAARAELRLGRLRARRHARRVQRRRGRRRRRRPHAVRPLRRVDPVEDPAKYFVTSDDMNRGALAQEMILSLTPRLRRRPRPAQLVTQPRSRRINAAAAPPRVDAAALRAAEAPPPSARTSELLRGIAVPLHRELPLRGARTRCGGASAASSPVRAWRQQERRAGLTIATELRQCNLRAQLRAAAPLERARFWLLADALLEAEQSAARSLAPRRAVPRFVRTAPAELQARSTHRTAIVFVAAARVSGARGVYRQTRRGVAAGGDSTARARSPVPNRSYGGASSARVAAAALGPIAPPPPPPLPRGMRGRRELRRIALRGRRWLSPRPPPRARSCCCPCRRPARAIALLRGDREGVQSEVIVSVPNIATADELQALFAAGLAACEARDAPPPSPRGAGRRRASARASGRNRFMVSDTFGLDTVLSCEEVLLRVLDRVDEQMPSVYPHLFAPCDEWKERQPNTAQGGPSLASPPPELAETCPSLRELYMAGELEWSEGEPAINVYTAGGRFGAHKDHLALTVLVPLTAPDEFAGGGTGFWAADSGGPPLPGLEKSELADGQAPAGAPTVVRSRRSARRSSSAAT